MSGSSTPWVLDTSGNIRTVSPRSLCQYAVSKHVCSVPYYYIPEQDIAAGRAEIDKEKEDKTGFWLGTIRTEAMTAEAQGYEKGPLQGFVKIKVPDIGQLQTFSRALAVASN